MGRLDPLAWQAWPAYGPTEGAGPTDLGCIECTQEQGIALLKRHNQAAIHGYNDAINLVDKRLESADENIAEILLDIRQKIQQIRDTYCVIPSDNSM